MLLMTLSNTINRIVKDQPLEKRLFYFKEVLQATLKISKEMVVPPSYTQSLNYTRLI